MKRLPPNKRNQLIGVVIATIGLICLVYFLLISPEKGRIHDLNKQLDKETHRLQDYKLAIKQMDTTTSEVTDATQRLNQAEDDLASGDLYAWTVETIRRFKIGYHRVDISTIGQPTEGDCELISGFPYKQIRFTLTGSAYYHDMGKFIADFENTFPHCQVLNLTADPSGTGEKLNFRIDIVALVKPNS